MIRLIITYCFSLTAFVLAAQEPYVKLEVTPSTVEKGAPVTVIIKTNVDGNLLFDVPDGFVKSGATHSGMSSSINYVNGKSYVEKQKYQQFTGYFEALGTYRLGPVKLQTKQGDLLSEAITIEVIKSTNMISENPEKNMDKPLFGIIEQSKKTVYLGEPFVLEAKVYAQIDVIQVENYEPFEVAGSSETHLIQDNRQVTRKHEKIEGKDVMTFKLGKSVVFPEQVGTFDVNPFQMIVFYDDPRRLFPDRTRLRSNETTIEVLPLPSNAPESFTGGVGSFKLTSVLSDLKIKQGKVVELSIQVKGHGNLHRIEAPRLILPKGMTLYGDPEENESFEFTSRGSEGIKTFTYYVQANQAGQIEFPALQMSYFNPESEQYEYTASQPLQIQVNKDASFTPIVTVEEEEEVEVLAKLQPVITQASNKGQSTTRYFTPVGIALATSPFLAALIFGFVVHYRKENETEMQQKRIRKDAKKNALQALESIDTSADIAVYFDEVQGVFQRFLSEKWGVVPAAINRNLVQEYMELGKISAETLAKLLVYFEKADQVRYGIASNSLTHETLKEMVVALINEIETSEC